MDWQPIETAPKDGTPVVVFAPTTRAGTIRTNMRTITVAYLDRFYWWCSVDGKHSLKPTHWMPLPPPPSDTATP